MGQAVVRALLALVALALAPALAAAEVGGGRKEDRAADRLDVRWRA